MTFRVKPPKIDPARFILSAVSPKQRFEAAMRIAREVFHDTRLTVKDIETAVERIRRKQHGAQRSLFNLPRRLTKARRS